jgi:hypothetical protein
MSLASFSLWVDNRTMTAVHSIPLRADSNDTDSNDTDRAADTGPRTTSLTRRVFVAVRARIHDHTPLETATEQALKGIRGVHSVHR